MFARKLAHLTLGLAVVGGAIGATGLVGVHADAMHRPINTACTDDTVPCISAWEPPVTAAGTATVTGYIHSAPVTVTLLIDDARAGTIYTDVQIPVRMSGDYAGYSQFRFVVPDTQIGERFTYLNVAVGLGVRTKLGKAFRFSNPAHLWSGTTSYLRRPYCTYVSGFLEAGDHPDGWNLTGIDFPANTDVSLRLVDIEHPSLSLYGATVHVGAGPNAHFSAHLPGNSFQDPSNVPANSYLDDHFQVVATDIATGRSYRTDPLMWGDICR